MECIVSKYFGKYVVSRADYWIWHELTGHEMVSRGYNLFGQHLGYFKKPIIKVHRRPIEGVALSSGIRTKRQVLAFIKQNKLQLIHSLKGV